MRRALNASPIEFLRYFTAFGAIVAVSLLSGCAVNDRAEADWQWKQSNPNYSSPVPQDQRREWGIFSDGDYGKDGPGGRPRMGPVKALNDPYEGVQQSLKTAGLSGHRRSENQVIVSARDGAIWPDRGNSFWISHKDGWWYLSTWLPVGYRLPANQDILQVCVPCMSVGNSAMFVVPPEIVERFKLVQIGDNEYERLFVD